MIKSLIYIIITGILWGGVGVIFSTVAREKKDFIGFMAVSSFFLLLGAGLFIPDYQILFAGSIPRLAALAGIMISGGVLTAIGMLAIQYAMQHGHQGTSWTIGQSALVFPFLTGVLLWQDTVTTLNVLGVTAIMVALIFFGQTAKKTTNTSNQHLSWFLSALIALIVLGISQTLGTIPSRWTGWSDVARLRIPLGLIGTMTGYIVLMLIFRRYPEKGIWKKVILLTVIVLPSHVLLFEALDIFASFSQAGLAYPIAVGTCVVSFALYSIFYLKEKTSKYQVIGLVLGIAGIILMSV